MTKKPQAKNPAAVALGKLSGKVRTPAKAAASRKNGKKGGRPPKVQIPPPPVVPPTA